MIKTSELKEKEVINIINGQRLGGIIDVDIDLGTGKVKGIVVPRQDKFFKFFNGKDDVYIPWSDIHKIGDDVILVKVNGLGDANFTEIE